MSSISPKGPTDPLYKQVFESLRFIHGKYVIDSEWATTVSVPVRGKTSTPDASDAHDASDDSDCENGERWDSSDDDSPDGMFDHLGRMPLKSVKVGKRKRELAKS